MPEFLYFPFVILRDLVKYSTSLDMSVFSTSVKAMAKSTVVLISQYRLCVQKLFSPVLSAQLILRKF